MPLKEPDSCDVVISFGFHCSVVLSHGHDMHLLAFYDCVYEFRGVANSRVEMLRYQLRQCDLHSLEVFEPKRLITACCLPRYLPGEAANLAPYAKVGNVRI